MAQSPYAYELVAFKEGDKFMPHARVECAKCGAHTTRRLTKTNMPPDVVAKFFKREGWDMDFKKRPSVRCPACQKSQNAKGEKPNKETSMSVAPVNAQPRELTADERLRVRSLLDKTFDDAKGLYLDGYSDQRVGTEANVPWLNVRKMREAAYGPLKAVPELDALVAEQRAIATKITEITGSLTAIQAQSNDLAKRIAGVASKMGVAA